MKSRYAALAILATTLLFPFTLIAQNSAGSETGSKLRYKLIDLGTLGGPIS
jgi:hypothetical protein